MQEITFITIEQQAKSIVYNTAGSPKETERQLKTIGLTHTKVRRGGIVKYILRGKNLRQPLTVKL